MNTRVLLIDGNDHDRNYYAQRLAISSPHYEIFRARTGRAGLQILKLQPIDCLITEFDLPDMSGFEVLLDVIPSEGHSSTAVVMLGKTILPAVANLAKRHGAQACLMKQWTSGDRLDSEIQKALAELGPTSKECHHEGNT